MTTRRARGDRSSPVMPRESGASSNHREACGYWIARRSLLPRKRERVMTADERAEIVPSLSCPAKAGIQ
jgi:hypothetical protein